MSKAHGGQIASVEEGSLGKRMGLKPGDILLSINDHPLRDVIDYRFYAAEEDLLLAVQRGEDIWLLRAQRHYQEDLGLEFEELLFDRLRRCRNCCSFCFVDQMPPGFRDSLYLKDDDLRLSFLFGNFITLSNWEAVDWRRVKEQRLSPLYISVHATDLELRRRLFANARLPDVKGQIRRLGESGIEVHAQIVLIPGLNDGQVLEGTVLDLAEFYPTVRSIAIVPLGLTRYHRGGLRAVTREEAEAVLETAHGWRRDLKRRYDRYLVHPSDEFYLLAEAPIPPASHYEGFPLLENGVGLARKLLDEWRKVRRPLPRKRHFTAVSGTLIAPLLGEIVADLGGRLIALESKTFGRTVTVSGLLGGRDVIEGLTGLDIDGPLFLPRVMFDQKGGTLDGMTLREMQRALGVPMVMAGSIDTILEALAKPELLV